MSDYPNRISLELPVIRIICRPRSRPQYQRASDSVRFLRNQAEATPFVVIDPDDNAELAHVLERLANLLKRSEPAEL